MKTRILAAVAAAFILAACVHDDDGDRDSEMGPPVLSEAYATGWVLVATPLGVQRAQSDCDETTCTVSLPGGIVEEYDLQTLKLAARAATSTAEQVEVRNGIKTARLAVEVNNLRFDALGIWGDHNLASPGRGIATVRRVSLPFVIPVSIGQSVGTNPVSGSATWGGLMAGVKYHDAGFDAEVLGDAAMQVDFADATLDLAFTNIAEQGTGARSADIEWLDVAMRDGEFSTADESLEGHFYGPNHEEAGGAFDQDGIAGVFSIKRE